MSWALRFSGALVSFALDPRRDQALQSVFLLSSPIFPFNNNRFPSFHAGFRELLSSHFFSTVLNYASLVVSIHPLIRYVREVRQRVFVIYPRLRFCWELSLALAASRCDAGSSCVVTVCLTAPTECSLSVGSGPLSADADWSFRPAAVLFVLLFFSDIALWLDRSVVGVNLARRTRFLALASRVDTLGSDFFVLEPVFV